MTIILYIYIYVYTHTCLYIFIYVCIGIYVFNVYTVLFSKNYSGSTWKGIVDSVDGSLPTKPIKTVVEITFEKKEKLFLKLTDNLFDTNESLHSFKIQSLYAYFKSLKWIIPNIKSARQVGAIPLIVKTGMEGFSLLIIQCSHARWERKVIHLGLWTLNQKYNSISSLTLYLPIKQRNISTKAKTFMLWNLTSCKGRLDGKLW